MKNFLNICIKADTPVRDAMKIIESESAQIVLVVDERKKLLGTLTDGDIRRGLLKNEKLDCLVEKLMNTDFIYIDESTSYKKALEIMKKEHISQVPVINKKGIIIDLVLLHEMLEKVRVNNHVVIMAGGKGKRLRPLTENCPKPMLEVNGKPMLEIILEKCINSGFHNFIFSVNYKKDKIINYFRNGSDWDVNIDYLNEEEPLGTAGSLSLLKKKFDEPLIVMNGDILTNFDINQALKFHIKNNAFSTIAVREYNVDIPFGVLEAQDINLVSFKEKPTYSYLINAGLYVLDPKILSFLKKGEYIDMPDLLEKVKKDNKRIIVCPIFENWMDIGRSSTLNEARNTWK